MLEENFSFALDTVLTQPLSTETIPGFCESISLNDDHETLNGMLIDAVMIQDIKSGYRRNESSGCLTHKLFEH